MVLTFFFFEARFADKNKGKYKFFFTKPEMENHRNYYFCAIFFHPTILDFIPPIL